MSHIDTSQEAKANTATRSSKRHRARNNRVGNNNSDGYKYNSSDNSNEQQQQLASSVGDESAARYSSGSDESLFSADSTYSDSADDSQSSSIGSNQLDSAIDDHNTLSGSSSGRSSANHVDHQQQVGMSTNNNNPHLQFVTPQTPQLNTTVNLIPATIETRDMIDSVRVKFLKNLKKNNGYERQMFEESDLIELKKPLPSDVNCLEQSLAVRLISRFLIVPQVSEVSDRTKNINDAVESLKALLEFRRQYQIVEISPEHFCKEFFQLYGIFTFGHDKHGIPLVYLRARVHRRWSRNFDESFRRYVAWQINQMTKSYACSQVSKSIDSNGIVKDGSFGICFDCLHVSYSCVDLDFLRFLVKILVHHYPTYCRYALCVDLPWLFRSVWKLVRSWLPEDAQNSVQLITAKELPNFIDEDQIPNCIKYNDTMKGSEKPIAGKHRIPGDSIKSVDEFAKQLNLSSNEVKQFKTHVNKVLKEYEQLGAV